MLNNVALDVFIGLIFVFLIYSLLATVLQEIVARMLDLRSKNLVKAIRVMLEDRDEGHGGYLSRWLQHVWTNFTHFRCAFPKDSLAKAFYTHPTIKYLSQSSWSSKPSYMGSYNFSTTIIKLLRGKEFDGNTDQMELIKNTLFSEKPAISSGSGKNRFTATIDPETHEQLKQLFLDSNKDINKFKLLLENWFNETMERASGWYKKQTQFLLFFLGLVIAMSFNADSIAIYNILSKDKKAREEFVQLASNSLSKYDTLQNQLIKVPVTDSVPILTKDSTGNSDTTGWTYKTTEKVLLSDTALNQAKQMLIEDIGNANNVLGLGRDWKDSCNSCKNIAVLVHEVDTNPSKANKKRLTQILSRNKDGVCPDKNCVVSRKCFQWHPLQRGGMVTFIGWVISALGISLGAPFWFDMLSKIMQIRGSGAKPKVPAPETAKDK
ncbi:MAG TPA: hypothetical protein VF868_13595 [Bacteroidia bacterium]|jgi:hypothetical protein